MNRYGLWLCSAAGEKRANFGSFCITPTCMDTAERDTADVGAAPAWKDSDDDSIEKAMGDRKDFVGKWEDFRRADGPSKLNPRVGGGTGPTTAQTRLARAERPRLSHRIDRCSPRTDVPVSYFGLADAPFGVVRTSGVASTAQSTRLLLRSDLVCVVWSVCDDDDDD